LRRPELRIGIETQKSVKTTESENKIQEYKKNNSLSTAEVLSCSRADMLETLAGSISAARATSFEAVETSHLTPPPLLFSKTLLLQLFLGGLQETRISCGKTKDTDDVE
jgi:hypothetical protein